MAKTEFTLNSTPEFCSRTFFSMDSKLSKYGYYNFEIPAFSKNSKLFQRLTEKLEFLKSAHRKNKKSDEAVDNENVEVDVMMRDDDLPDTPPDTDFLPSHIDDADIRIENCPENNLSEAPEVALNPEFPTEENPLAEEPPQKSLRELAQEQFDLCSKELQKFSITTELSEAAREWEESIVPFLEEQEKRENFDIDVYGSRILNAFEDNNRKQSMYFRHFCKNMQKWEIHRYFMALLPLANIGNVAIDKERREDGSDDIIVTLLSRKMHHKELEEFGHSEGSHP
ncbi:condensin-2 complex subunit H2-like [Stegodyphus dumicola]|uniref:condensin-2 complex subunit H2-like n=1 Tax=Stegodyphus dumicola TaxID=202533 RepID=UPI0015AD5A15|nr:condensin-2 complex subunit H2-like [Stegodyphus dumicola]XP_035223302.1 condensin-2 complex subunit H2-like [Stegodyphus dumicola]